MSRMTPGQALRRLGAGMRGARVIRTLHVAPLKTSYLVEKNAQRFVLRVDEPGARAMGLDRAAEFANLHLAWRAGVAPEPIALRGGAQPVLLMRYAPGRAWTAADLRRPPGRNDRLEELAALLRSVHAVPGSGRPLDLEKALAGYAHRAGGPAAQRLLHQARRVLARSGLGQGEPVLCHHDPIAANVVGIRHRVLIDWEYAARGDPLFDLAVVIRHHRLPARLAARFAVAYFGRRDRVPWERLQGAMRVYDYVLHLWLLAMAAKDGLSPGHRRHLAFLAGDIM